jgi:hypothetical protein
MAGEGLRRRIKMGNQGGGVKTLIGMSVDTGPRGVARGGEERWWRGQDRSA